MSVDDSHQSAVEPPRVLRTLGVANILYALFVLPINDLFLWADIAQISKLEVSVEAEMPVWWAAAGYGFTSLVLIVAGIGLCWQFRWGRWLSLIGAGLIFLSPFVASYCVRDAFERTRALYHGFPETVEFWSNLPALWPGYGAVLIVLLNSPSVHAWVRSERDRRQGVFVLEPSGDNPQPTLSALAVVTFVLALTPAGGLTQAAALITGIIARGRIRRSRGRLMGLALAVAGMTFSVLIIAGFVVWNAVAQMTVGTLWQSMPLTAVCSLVAFALIPLLMPSQGQKKPSNDFAGDFPGFDAAM